MGTEISERVDWAEVEALAKPIITVWVNGAELRFGAYAWEALAQDGLTTYATEVERTQCVLRAVALGALCRDFYARAFDEGSLGEWREYITSDLIGTPPLVAPFTLGQLAEREGIDADNTLFGDGVFAEVLCVLVDDEYRTVARTLGTRWGDDGLFAALLASANGNTVYPLADKAVAAAVNSSITANKLMAWEWLTQGL